MNRFQLLLILFGTLAMVMEFIPLNSNWGINQLRLSYRGSQSVLPSVARVCSTGGCLEEKGAVRIGSEELNRRRLAQNNKYISYGALGKDAVPCNRKGQSYYNCVKMKKVNPYKRGCSAITHCKRFTD